MMPATTCGEGSITAEEVDHNDDVTSTSMHNRLEVKPSLIPSAGQGLFVTCPVKKGEVVCEYWGKVLTTREAMRSEGKDYMMRLGPQVYVDATHYPQVLARYINDCRNPKGYNVQFIKLPEEKKALVVALHDLEPGDELWVDYGRWYWAMKTGTRLVDKALERLRLERCQRA